MLLKTYQEHFLPGTSSIEDAIARLDKIATKLIMVVNSDDLLLGTVTDGDIRRALLRHLPIDTQLSNIMNTQPKYISQNDSEIKAHNLKEIYGIPAIPKLDTDMHVIDLIGANKDLSLIHI